MMKLFCKFFIVSVILLQELITPTEAMLLTSPPPIAEEEVEERANALSLEMRWHSNDAKNGQRSSIGFERKNGQTIMQIQFEEEFPQELAAFENRFTFSTPQDKKVWTFMYGNNVTDELAALTEAPLSLEEAMGIVHPPRILENQYPQMTAISDIIELIRDKHCVFYTGAGISAGVVPTMPQLMEKLQLKNGQGEGKGGFLITLQSALKNPALYVQPMDEFYKACLYGKPTPAHLAIRDVAQKKNWGLLTENLDLLHQRSGIKPLYRDNSDWLKSNVTETDLNKIHYVITIGLASDESGFLGWYKATHPQGTIIAINLQQPNYLAGDDLLVTGDVQELLPLLCDQISKELK